MNKYGSQIPIDIQVLSEENASYMDEFYCGNESIDSYFNKQAVNDRSDVTYLFIDCGENRLVACMTIACSAIFKEDEELPLTTILSAIEIKYFAVDERYKHLPYTKGSRYTLSQSIFEYMLARMEEFSHTTIGASKIVLYSVPEAVHFYMRFDFKEFGEAMYGDVGSYVAGCLPMYFDLNDNFDLRTLE